MAAVYNADIRTFNSPGELPGEMPEYLEENGNVIPGRK